MGQDITLTAGDGFQLHGYRADPEGTPRGGIVVIMEIFGVNEHIRDLCDRFAEVGYLAVAPALYDRFEKGFEVGYTPDDIAKGRVMKDNGNAHFDNVMLDVEAARKVAAEAGKVGITGYCWGGVVTWAAACRLDFQAASAYYGGGILPYVNELPNCPTILHFGKLDQSIPLTDVEKIAKTRPECPVYLYDADHGFHCDMRGSFNPHAAQVASIRTFRLFDEHLAG
ncbi:MAG: carboxymethylenebutenolidase [Rhodospirillaceae bacterium]|nr:carboxymethylenebutenolidase [Magnetovibrio sp.]MAY66118.1 carboxymethylenebutenolidase [Rhodospirillaceae bacterium]